MQKSMNYVPRQKYILLKIFTVQQTITVNNEVRGVEHLLERYL